MARKPRVWFPGAIYHITSRGNRRSSLFFDPQDYLMYLSLLEKTRSKYPFNLHAYCLMTNHLHLLLETIQFPTNKIIQRTHSLYAIYFNKRYHTNGHLFQGRYYAEIIKDDSHFLTASKYIHLNPVEARMVPHPAHYRWSSYSGYISSRKDPHIKTDKVLSYFSQSPIQSYRKYVEGV